MLPLLHTVCMKPTRAIRRDHWSIQVAKVTAAHEDVSKQLAETEQSLGERSAQLTQTTASLEGKETELIKLSQQHQALIMQHERLEGELSDLTGVFKAKQKEAEALQDRYKLCSNKKHAHIADCTPHCVATHECMLLVHPM